MKMMPAAVLLLFGELWIMDKLVLPDPKPQQARAAAQAKPKTRKYKKLALDTD